MVAAMRRALLEFYDRRSRDLPWRRTRDPYRIWVSEVMLQQTRAATVAPRYTKFLARFPTVATLAAARVEAVCAEWAGLGYYARARNLHAAAVAIRRRHRGRVPAEIEALLALPGVGRYTAAAIASIAYSSPVAAIDGNVERVLARVLADTVPEPGARSARLRGLAKELVACTRPGCINQSLMDVGASICTPRAPRCQECPLRPHCAAHRRGDPGGYPARRATRKVQRLQVAFAWIESRAGVWLERRDLEGLWGGLWQPPGAEGPVARTRLSERLGVSLTATGVRVDHVLTHRLVRATVYRAESRPRLRRSERLRPYAAPLQAPLSGLARRVIEAFTASTGS